MHLYFRISDCSIYLGGKNMMLKAGLKRGHTSMVDWMNNPGGKSGERIMTEEGLFSNGMYYSLDNSFVLPTIVHMCRREHHIDEQLSAQRWILWNFIRQNLIWFMFISMVLCLQMLNYNIISYTLTSVFFSIFIFSLLPLFSHCFCLLNNFYFPVNYFLDTRGLFCSLS